MSIPLLKDPELRAFISANMDRDVAQLALAPLPRPEWPRAAIMDQIRARQKMAVKNPSWAGNMNLIMPPADVVEQASSPATARYKAGLVPYKSFADLTAGAGIDSAALAARAQNGVCIEADGFTADVLAHNMACVTSTPVEVMQGRAGDVISTLPPTDLIYIDPQRREAEKRGKFLLSQTQPDVTALLPQLEQKARFVMVKTSPVLDITRGIQELQHVREVHILECARECREVVYILDMQARSPPAGDVPVTVAIIDEAGTLLTSYTNSLAREKETGPAYADPARFLYDPGPALRKSGLFQATAQDFSLIKLGRDTHLYTSDRQVEGFPGRRFEIISTLPVRKQEVHAALTEGRAHLALRNFPGHISDLQKKLGLRDGGDEFVFATTLHDGRKTLIRAIPR